MVERMTVGALIEELQAIAAGHPLGDLTPVMVQLSPRPTLGMWLTLTLREVYTLETGEKVGKSGHTSYEALVITGSPD